MYASSDSLIFRFGQALPTEYTYMTESTDKSFYRSASAASRKLKEQLLDSGVEKEKVFKIIKAFDDEIYTVLEEMQTELKEIQKGYLDQLSKVAVALEKITKTKILEYVHDSDDFMQKAQEKLEKLANEYAKEKA